MNKLPNEFRELVDEKINELAEAGYGARASLNDEAPAGVCPVCGESHKDGFENIETGAILGVRCAMRYITENFTIPEGFVGLDDFTDMLALACAYAAFNRVKQPKRINLDEYAPLTIDVPPQTKVVASSRRIKHISIDEIYELDPTWV